MSRNRARGLSSLAVVIFFLAPAALRAETHVESLESNFSASFSVGQAVSDDLATINKQSRNRARSYTEPAESVASTPDSSVGSELSVNEQQRWVIGVFGAVCTLGLGITVAGMYFTGPRALTRARW